MSKMKVPLNWPKALGGFGVPGKLDAPERWRKAAAALAALPVKSRPDLGLAMGGTSKSTLQVVARKCVDVALMHCDEIHVKRRDKNGTILETTSGPVMGLDLEEVKVVRTIKDIVPDTHSKFTDHTLSEELQLKVREVTGLSGIPSSNSTFWVGLPRHLLEPVLITQFESMLRAGPLFTSSDIKRMSLQDQLKDQFDRLIKQLRLEAREHEDNSPRFQSKVARREKKLSRDTQSKSMRLRAHSANRIVDKLIAGRPGVTPVDLRNVSKLVGVQRKASTLYKIESIFERVGALGLDGWNTVKAAVASAQGAQPNCTRYSVEGAKNASKMSTAAGSHWGDMPVLKTATYQPLPAERRGLRQKASRDRGRRIEPLTGGYRSTSWVDHTGFTDAPTADEVKDRVFGLLAKASPNGGGMFTDATKRTVDLL